MNDFLQQRHAESFAEASKFEEKVRQHLEHIFPAVQKDVNPSIKNPLKIESDLSATSLNQRLILFQVKYYKSEKNLPRSVYISMANFKNTVDNIFIEKNPITVLITNVSVSDELKKTFRKSGIPVINLGEDFKETHQRLINAFQQLAIYIPELSSDVQFSKSSSGKGFVSIPMNEDFKFIYEQSIKPALLVIGYESRTINQISFSQTNVFTEIERADVFIADLTTNNPNVLFEAGVAVGLKKDVIFISQRNEINFDFAGFKFIFYQNTQNGLHKLRNMIMERLKILQNIKT